MVSERKRNYWRKQDHSENSGVPDEEAIKKKVFERKGFVPNAWQIRSIQTMMARRDVVVISSTGSGKSICYQALAMLAEESGGGVLCISPLKQLMQEQVDSAIKAGIKAVYINEDSTKANPNIWKEVEDAQYQLVYVCPESWLKEDSYFWNHLSRRPNKFMSRLIAVAIDEAHCIWAYWWFRVDYRAIGRMRDCMPGIPFMALSATLPPNVRSYVSKSLRFENALYIIESVRRSNIRIIVSKITSLSNYLPLKILIPEDMTTSESIPITMIFVDSRNQTKDIAIYLRQLLPESLRKNGKTIIRAYGAFLDQKVRDVYVSDLRAGVTRILVCTDACGMGLDLDNIARVVQWDVNSALVLISLYQRFGRAGRDPTQEAVAIVFAPANCFFESSDEPPAPESEVKRRKKSKSKKPELPVLSDFYQAMRLAVTKENWAAIEELLGALYRQCSEPSPPDKDGFKTGYRKLDPALIFFLNTSGCRYCCVLAILGDPEIFELGGDGCGHCDNCIVEHSMSRSVPEHSDPLHGISTELSITYILRMPRGAESTESQNISLDNVEQYSSPPPVLRKPSQIRLALLQEHLLIWRNKVWEKLPQRDYILCEDLLPQNMITKLKSNAGKIRSSDDLRTVLALSPASGLIPFIPELLNCVFDSLRSSENLPGPPTPVRPRGSGRPKAKRPPLRNIINIAPRPPRVPKFIELK